MFDRLAALEKLARICGMFQEAALASATDGWDLDLKNMSDEELERLAYATGFTDEGEYSQDAEGHDTGPALPGPPGEAT